MFRLFVTNTHSMLNNKPLADRLRPTTLDEVVGQQHILGKNRILRNIIESGNIPNMIFYGLSGTGKTTVANIAAKSSNKALYRLNATNASVSDIKNIVRESDGLFGPVSYTHLTLPTTPYV